MGGGFESQDLEERSTPLSQVELSSHKSSHSAHATAHTAADAHDPHHVGCDFFAIKC